MSELWLALVVLTIGLALVLRLTVPRRGSWDKHPRLEEPDELVQLTPPPLELLQRGGPWP
jgi:hypothetical protein